MHRIEFHSLASGFDIVPCKKASQIGIGGSCVMPNSYRLLLLWLAFQAREAEKNGDRSCEKRSTEPNIELESKEIGKFERICFMIIEINDYYWIFGC